MRENPWHQPAPTAEHEQRFLNLMGLHRLTTAWLKDLDLDLNATAYQLKRVSGPEVRPHLQKLAEITRGDTPATLERLVDASPPEEFLARFEYAVNALQAWTLRNILERTSEAELPALRNLLEQSSWKEGRRCAQERWSSFPTDAARDARGLLAALRNSPFSGYPDGHALLIRRGTSREVDLELMACPHQSPYPEVLPAADDLCAYQAQWMRGYIYALNPMVVVDHKIRTPGKGRCRIQVHRHEENGAGVEI